jgi:exonuclease III
VEYKIGSFNVRNLNATGVQKVDDRAIIRSFETIKNIIKEEDFAVVALQEVLSRDAAEKIRSILGDNWKSEWDQPPPKQAGGKADPRGEGYAYLWDTTKLDLISVEFDNEMRTFMPRIWHQYQKNGQKLIREPYYARFSPVGKTGGCFCEIRLINTHIVYGNKNTDGINMRKEEFLKVVKNVYQNVANKRYKNNMPAYVIVLGDYNLSLEQL